jgi:hypothetical protein
MVSVPAVIVFCLVCELAAVPLLMVLVKRVKEARGGQMQ